ncbi:tRNA lysidine(34) synthetase TilS [Chelativorans sp. ZYF759]|nr:tRNA lysidine(34) synthetase TilS [Chelativorans sp. ZYF759]
MGPLTRALFAGIDFNKRKTIIAAVSGGSDSLALLDLAATALAGRSTELVAVTIDHNLRPEAADEAGQVAAICANLGLRHMTLRWENADPAAGGLIARAREARYRLLAEAADTLATDLVLVGHTANDQAETVAMRAQRGRPEKTGWDRGGAGMARATLYDGRIWLVRPLLDLDRQELRAHLSARGLTWIDDPTNVDLRYERPRIRAGLGDITVLSSAAGKAADLRAAMGARAARLIDAHVDMPSPGLIRLNPALLRADDDEAVLYALRCLLATAGGQDHLPDIARARSLRARLGEAGLCATLSRARVDVRRGGIFLMREGRNLPRIPARQGIVWDGRHRLRTAPKRPGVMIAAPGQEALARGTGGHTDLPEHLVGIALSAEPRLVGEGPDESHDTAAFERRVSPFAQYLGHYDLELATALARVLGTAPPPPAPFA